MKKFLFILRHPPCEGACIRESLDMMMTVAAFAQAVRVLFLDDGVYLLKSGQCSDNTDIKPTAPLFKALELYDVEGLWVEQESLLDRGLNGTNLIVPVYTLPRKEIASFISAADIVVSG